MKPKTRRAANTLKRVLIVAIIIGICAIGFAKLYDPVRDWITLSQADPAMIALADEAGMSHQGEIVFLQTRPQLVSDQTMTTVCSENTASNNKNGFIEQGCYSPSTNRIYIRQMPAELHDLESSTAAYEMLHPVYVRLHSSAAGQTLDSVIEDNYSLMHDASLQSQVANFAKTEPGARDLELFSLLGTGYKNVTPRLAAYYDPYFSNIGLTITANQRIQLLFQQDQNQIGQLNTSIITYARLAQSDYATSVAWARDGSVYEDNLYYGRYRQDVDSENEVIAQYNNLIINYNALVTQFNGSQPVKQLDSAQASSSQ